MSLDRSEFHALYRELGPAVRARCRAICGNDADADEALQEAFLRAWNARNRFDGRYPLAWLHSIARNTSLDILRRKKPLEDDPLVWLELPAKSVEEGSELEARRLLETFDIEDAAILRLRHAEGWRIHEIAEYFETSQRTVRRRLERIERRARALLGLEKVSHVS